MIRNDQLQTLFIIPHYNMAALAPYFIPAMTYQDFKKLTVFHLAKVINLLPSKPRTDFLKQNKTAVNHRIIKSNTRGSRLTLARRSLKRTDKDWWVN